MRNAETSAGPAEPCGALNAPILNGDAGPVEATADHDISKKELTRARNTAYRYLSIRPRSRSEVVHKLKEKGFSDQVVDDTLQHLGRLDYVNDREFAAQWTRSRVRLRGFGRRKIEQELRAKGIDRELIEEAFSVAFEDLSEHDIALGEAEKKMKTLARFEPEVRRRRIAGMLERKGFSPEIIYSILNSVSR